MCVGLGKYSIYLCFIRFFLSQGKRTQEGLASWGRPLALAPGLPAGRAFFVHLLWPPLGPEAFTGHPAGAALLFLAQLSLLPPPAPSWRGLWFSCLLPLSSQLRDRGKLNIA